MNCGNVIVRLPDGVLSALQLDRLQQDMAIHVNAAMSPNEVSLMRSKIDAHLRASGALAMDGQVSIETCKPEPEPEITLTLALCFERREMLDDDTWTKWHSLDLNDPAEGLKDGQHFQQRVNQPRGRGWEEGPVLVHGRQHPPAQKG